jgi:hypothetical protein
LHVHVLPVPHHVRLGGCQVELRLRRRRRRSDTRPHTQAITSHNVSRNGAQLTHLVGQIHHEGRDGVVHAVQNRLRKRIARVSDASHRHSPLILPHGSASCIVAPASLAFCRPSTRCSTRCRGGCPRLYMVVGHTTAALLAWRESAGAPTGGRTTRSDACAT